tara:strand:+ start:596 stop:862 length:267 start_codon:yes stop_codon:yes gene_type:complete
MDNNIGMNQQQMSMKALENATDLTCKARLTNLEHGVEKVCGSKHFQEVFMLKKISALASPTGQVAVIPIQLYSCAVCGTSLELEDLTK